MMERVGINNLYASLPPGYIFRSTLSVLFGGTGLFMAMECAKGSEHVQRKWLMPLVHRLFEPETAHRLAVLTAKYRAAILLSTADCRRDHPQLHCRLFGRQLTSPIGLAAGFDKNGEAIVGLRRLGFAFIEIGSVTPKPQPGNDRPRVFRLVEDRAVINSYGFNSDGVKAVVERVKQDFDAHSAIPLGINLGKNKTTEDAVQDYAIGANHFAPHCDYLVVNISSPNTPGLRALQSREELKKITSKLRECLQKKGTVDGDERWPKLFVKIAPDLSHEELEQIAEVCMDARFGVDGLIIGNTTTSRPDSLKSAEASRAGGLSGAPLRDISTQCVREMYTLTGGTVPIIGCGGVSSGADAYEKIRAGASAVQLYTALVYDGFPVVGRVKRELAELLKRDGYESVEEAIGADHGKSKGLL